jgi:hypothetical protein
MHKRLYNQNVKIKISENTKMYNYSKLRKKPLASTQRKDFLLSHICPKKKKNHNKLYDKKTTYFTRRIVTLLM